MDIGQILHVRVHRRGVWKVPSRTRRMDKASWAARKVYS
jgi:hypothetical protein